MKAWEALEEPVHQREDQCIYKPFQAILTNLLKEDED